jgi:hypothetical protein
MQPSWYEKSFDGQRRFSFVECGQLFAWAGGADFDLSSTRGAREAPLDAALARMFSAPVALAMDPAPERQGGDDEQNERQARHAAILRSRRRPQLVWRKKSTGAGEPKVWNRNHARKRALSESRLA